MFKFDPTITMGNLISLFLTVCTAAGLWTLVRTDQATARVELDSLKATAVYERGETKGALNDIKGDVKEIQKSVNNLNEGVAILRGRALSTEGKTK